MSKRDSKSDIHITISSGNTYDHRDSSTNKVASSAEVATIVGLLGGGGAFKKANEEPLPKNKNSNNISTKELIGIIGGIIAVIITILSGIYGYSSLVVAPNIRENLTPYIDEKLKKIEEDNTKSINGKYDKHKSDIEIRFYTIERRLDDTEKK